MKFCKFITRKKFTFHQRISENNRDFRQLVIKRNCKFYHSVAEIVNWLFIKIAKSIGTGKNTNFDNWSFEKIANFVTREKKNIVKFVNRFLIKIRFPSISRVKRIELSMLTSEEGAGSLRGLKLFFPSKSLFL